MDISKKRQTENQAVFRRANEKVEKGLKKEIAKAEKDRDQVIKTDLEEVLNTPLHFYCECSDEKCRQRIIMTVSEYEQFHKKRDEFIVVPGHEVPSIERVAKRTAKYFVVSKFQMPPEKPSKLNPTNLQNA